MPHSAEFELCSMWHRAGLELCAMRHSTELQLYAMLHSAEFFGIARSRDKIFLPSQKPLK
jgi:hypothetical protein